MDLVSGVCMVESEAGNKAELVFFVLLRGFSLDMQRENIYSSTRRWPHVEVKVRPCQKKGTVAESMIQPGGLHICACHQESDWTWFSFL
jgi:hypothetical protein